MKRLGKYHNKQPGFAGPMLDAWRNAIFHNRAVTAREIIDAFDAGALAPEDSALRRFRAAVLAWSPDAKPGDGRSLCLRDGITENGYRLRYQNGRWRVFAIGENGDSIEPPEDPLPPVINTALYPVPPGYKLVRVAPLPPARAPTMTPAWAGNAVPAPGLPVPPPAPAPEGDDDDDYDWDAIDSAMGFRPGEGADE